MGAVYHRLLRTGHAAALSRQSGIADLSYRAVVELCAKDETRTLRIEGPVANLGGRKRRMPTLRGMSPFDHRGHLIGLQFGGPDNRENLCPMHGRLNMVGAHSPWSTMEKTIVRMLGDGRGHMTVRLGYAAPDDLRPHRIHVQLQTLSHGVCVWQFMNFSPDLSR